VAGPSAQPGSIGERGSVDSLILRVSGEVATTGLIARAIISLTIVRAATHVSTGTVGTSA
jgi:hypothetical protein